MTDLERCPGCGRLTDPDGLWDCADSAPGWPQQHCDECVGDCGMCQDERAREWQAEVRADIRRFGP